MNKEIVLFYYPNRKLFISKLAKKKLKKIFKCNSFENLNKNKFLKFKYNKKRLNKIANNYKKKGINLDLKRIYEINLFLQKINQKTKSSKIFVSPYFINGVIFRR